MIAPSLTWIILYLQWAWTIINCKSLTSSHLIWTSSRHQQFHQPNTIPFARWKKSIVTNQNQYWNCQFSIKSGKLMTLCNAIVILMSMKAIYGCHMQLSMEIEFDYFNNCSKNMNKTNFTDFCKIILWSNGDAFSILKAVPFIITYAN